MTHVVTTIAVLFFVFAIDCRVEARAGNVFKTANFPIESRAKNAVLAKKQAISDGQAAAFQSLLKRLVPVTAYSRLERLKDKSPTLFIESMEVRSEQNSSTEYIANLDFVFNADTVRDLLRREGIPFIDSQAQPTIVVPVYQSDNGQPVQSGSGAWSKIWQSLDIKNAIAPLSIRPLPSAIGNDILSEIDSKSSLIGKTLAKEYKSNSVVVALAQHDTQARKIKVKLVGHDAVGSISLTRSYRIFDGDTGFATEFAAVVSLGILEGRWKELKYEQQETGHTQRGYPQNVSLKVEFQSPSQWYRIQQQISETPGVEGLQIASLSARSANISLNYPGGGAQLASVLSRKGFSMDNFGSQWLLKPRF